MQELFTAIQQGDLAACQQLLSQAAELASSRNEQGVSALMMSLYCGQEEIARLVAASGLELNLLEAAALGDEDRMVQCLQAGDDPLAFSDDGFTPLHFAAFFGRSAIVRRLLDLPSAEVNVEATNGSGLHPLNSAVAGGHLEVVKLLLDHGADVELPQAGGVTCLMGAAAGGHRKILQLLLDHRADASRTCENFKTAADYATERGHGELVPLVTAP